ncbi:hypothetical protein OCOJLMKI_2680 [Methylobacterium iners]|uniref:Uncharacterized protein n=2 Tax=Methylobacterium iners TaxID=418707 RepID=A0ABQ4RXB0_9HYPH|nr:hypothetical protein OCOJLMKI_2680 [Methylobacterium iners]
MGMRAFWNDGGIGPISEQAEAVDLRKAGLIWSDTVRSVQGNFLGLIDDRDRTVQFYLQSGIPDDVDDASHLRIVLMDFPQPERKGSYGRLVAIGEVHRLIETAFRAGADPRHFGEMTFSPW